MSKIWDRIYEQKLIFIALILLTLHFYPHIKRKQCQRWWKQDSHWVKKIDGDTFKQEVFDSDLPVIVLFGDPRGKYSCYMIPVAEEIAKKYQGRVKVCKKITEFGGSEKFGRSKQCIGSPQMVLYKNGKVITNLKNWQVWFFPCGKPFIDTQLNKGRYSAHFSKYLEQD